MTAYTDPELRARLKRKLMAENVAGTLAGQWSARKSQLLRHRYEAAIARQGLASGYKGPKTKAQKDLTKWTGERWGTKSGKPSSETGERYLPAKRLAAMSDADYARTSAKKRRDRAAGKQHSPMGTA
jgi:Family of unknown function (DUF5872)